tara:strand:- start:293 stop:832 length:540 start_codon:yes stop_codon:yes gene_type:complete
MTQPKARGNRIALRPDQVHNQAMKHNHFSWIAGMLMVTACAPLNTYYKPGVSVNMLERQTLACQTQALREVPSSTQVRRTPPRFIPPQQRCNAAGACVMTPGRYIPGDLVTFDPNDGLRKRVEQQCMADKGFAPVSIPLCPDAIARATPARATMTLPPLNPNSCVIRNSDGSFQIVTRG